MTKKKNPSRAAKLHKQLERDILKAFEEAGNKELNYKQVSARLGVSDQFTRSLVEDMLLDLAERGDLEQPESGKFKRKPSTAYAEGSVDMLSSGNAFVIVEGMDDIFVNSQKVNNALHGDLVKVFLYGRKRGDHVEGEIVEILKRARTEFVGTLQVSEKYAFLVPDSNHMNTDIFVPVKDLNGGKSGDKAVVRITAFPEKSKNPVGEVIRVLGRKGENETEIHAILAEYGFPSEFPKHVEAEAEKITFDIPETEIKKRRDMRKVTTFTIDPADAKDFDDALSIQQLDNGHWEIGVHIADVSHYMPEGSLLDQEAYQRATSVYLVDRVVPMLPEKLSNGVCSLRPHEEKLCYSAIFEIDDNAQVHQEWFGRTVIYSDRRFTYEEAQKVIETGQGDLAEEIATFHRLATKMRNTRFASGALRVEQTEVKFKLDNKGKPYDVYFKESKEANWLIEEFMLLANKKVAAFVGQKKERQQEVKTFVYRIHDLPNEEKLKELKRFVHTFGYKIDLNNPKTIAASLNKMLNDVKGKPEADMIENLTIRSMAKAIYSTQNVGHYGLSFDFYTHFTSPIRRYPDVMVHRLLDRYLQGGKSVNAKDYEAKCKHSSEMEKKAADAERASVKYKQVEYLEDRVGDEFEGVITGVTEWGIYVEILENKCEGMVRLRSMDDDFYVFDEKHYTVRGKKYGKTYRLGDKVKILVKAADVEKRQIDFEMK